MSGRPHARHASERWASLKSCTGLLWTIGSVILVFTGIFAILGRRDPERIKTIPEKARAALIFGIAGLLVAALQ